MLLIGLFGILITPMYVQECFLFLQSRAQTATENILELNEDVRGDFVDEVLINYCDFNFSAWKQLNSQNFIQLRPTKISLTWLK